MANTVLNIIGPIYSGSTVLQAALNTHPDISAAGELYHACEPYYSESIDKWESPLYCTTCRAKTCGVFFDLPWKIDRIYEILFQRYKTPFIIDSSKTLGWFQQVEREKNGFPRSVKYLFLSRSPDMLIDSLQRYGSRDSILTMLNDIETYTLQILDFLAGKDFRFLDWHSAAGKEGAMLFRLLDWIGVSTKNIDPKRMRMTYWETAIHQLAGNYGVIDTPRPLIIPPRTPAQDIKNSAVRDSVIKYDAIMTTLSQNIFIDTEKGCPNIVPAREL